MAAISLTSPIRTLCRAPVHKGYDVAFIALHGRWRGQDASKVFLEVLHLPYTFSGVLSSALSADKERAGRLPCCGHPVPQGITLALGSELIDDDLDAIVDEMGLPLLSSRKQWVELWHQSRQ